MEEYNTEHYKEHKEVKRPYTDKLDGRKYVLDVIEWHIFKVSATSAVHHLIFLKTYAKIK